MQINVNHSRKYNYYTYICIEFETNQALKNKKDENHKRNKKPDNEKSLENV